MEEVSVTIPKYQPLRVLWCRYTSDEPSLPARFTRYSTISTFIVRRINNLKSVEIGSASFLIQLYKFLPSTKIILTWQSLFFLLSFFHFHRTLFLWACGSFRESRKFFSNSLFVHSLVCLIIHSFLHGFQPNLYQHFSHVCSICLTTFNLK